CPRDSKQSALVTTIRWAREKGLQLISEFEVFEILPGETVRVRGQRAGHAEEVQASKVVLAAGAFGNSAILLRSGFKKKLPALGTRFACHPQFMSYALFDDTTRIDAHKGAFQAVKSYDPKLREWGFKLENVFAPPIATAMLMEGCGEQHARLMKKFRYMASMEVAIRDEPSGVIELGGPKLRIKKRLTGEDLKKSRRGLQVVRELFESVGAKKIIQCPQSFGLHLMGGCPIGTDGASAVIDPEFRVHGERNLFAADSSIFPSAPGINPSFTIMALSHRASRAILRGTGA